MEKVFKGKRLLQVLIMLLLVPIGMQAQNVTIKATNGSMIASTPTGYTDPFYNSGGFATWQHGQLSMVLTASDNTTKTQSGQLANPANNLYSDGTHIQIAKGQSTYNICYLSLSLPKGYRFTSYTITFSKPNQLTKTLNTSSTQFNTVNAPSTFGETNSNFVYTNYKEVARGGASQTIARTALSDDDMDNVLYFMLSNPSDSRALITLESAEFYFTAEADYAPLTTPGNAQRVSAIDIPFSTSKVDYGSIESRSYNGATRIAYSSANVKDLEANFTLFEEGSVVDGEDFDGVSGKVVDYKEGSISVEDGYYRIGAEDAQNPGTEEHIYYIETPSYVLLSDNVTKNPVGYRIVGAQIDYKYGPTNQYGTTQKTYDTFYISYGYGTTYYLNSTGGATTTQSQRALWFIDDEGYIRTGTNGNTYLSNKGTVSGGTRYASTTINKEDAVKCSINSNGYISYVDGSTTYYLRQTTSYGTSYFRFQNSQQNRATRTISGTTTVNISGVIGTVAAQPYTLKLYDKTGNTAESVEVNSENPSGSLYVAGMNNDAVKIGVVGTGLIQGTLTLQALDPYLDHMSVVCQDEVQTAIRLNQTFTASDFSVSGGEFYFYLPQDCAGHTVAITFEDLQSKYFDETYNGGDASHTSRINFVKSAHYNAFGESSNKIYNDVSEASNAQLERLKVGTVGTAKFKFNNAEDLSTANGILTEYPFSLENYAAAPNNGSFTNMGFTVSASDQALTRYVFTTDETRYNIAPTTAVQHRTYAYYEMIVHVQTSTYEPKVEFTKIYDPTLYGTGQTDAFYGAKVTAYDGNTPPKAGYSSTAVIFQKIEEAIARGTDDFGNACSDLKDAKQLLYLDFSEMAGIYQTTDDSHGSMEDFSATNAANCIIFIPFGASAPNNNVCYKTEAGTFMAAHDIVLTDKQPFYSPYDIYMSGTTSKVSYKRAITKDKYGKVQNASLILPFIVAVDENGKHTNPDGTSFTLHTMKSSEALKLDGESTFAYFPSLSNVTVTTANTPYMVKLEENSSEDGISFVVEQTGSTIFASTSMASDYTFTGAASTGVAVDASEAQPAATYTFTPTGTYAGQKVPKTNNIFYFASNQFVSSADLITSGNVNIAPFRAYYATSTSGNVRLSNLGVIFEDGEGDTDAIRTLRQNDLGMSIQAGRGQLTISAAEDSDVRIAGVNGISRGNFSVKAGETRTVSVPAGIYVVNGVKIVVK